MIEWGSENWGGNVHYAANGSWVADRHGDDDADHEDQQFEDGGAEPRSACRRPLRPAS